MPKNAGVHSNFGRSILILTPQRALKVTAPSRERHHVWLTALSFLSHSTLAMDDLAAVPPIPLAEHQLPSSQNTHGGRRSPRDSIRVAKSKERPNMQARNYTAPIGASANKVELESCVYNKTNDSVSDAAEPPQIPRVSAHTRKRSNTGPRPSLQSAFHSFPTHIGLSSSHGVKNATTRDIVMSVSRGFHGSSNDVSSTRHQSETAIAPPEPIRNDFFDAVGTVRMEAFVDSTKFGKAETGRGDTLPRSSYRTRQGRKKDMSYWGIAGESSNYGASGPLENKPAWKVEDPFRGF